MNDLSIKNHIEIVQKMHRVMRGFSLEHVDKCEKWIVVVKYAAEI